MKAEVIRRYYRALVDFKKGNVPAEVPERIKLLMNELGVSEQDRLVATKAKEKRQQSHNLPSACIQIGKHFINGRKTHYLSPISSTILNALKTINKIPDEIDLISSSVLKPILDIQNKVSNFKEDTLKLNEVLIALSICSTTNPLVQQTLNSLNELRGAELHSTHMITDDEMVILNNLGINATCGTIIDVN